MPNAPLKCLIAENYILVGKCTVNAFYNFIMKDWDDSFKMNETYINVINEAKYRALHVLRIRYQYYKHAYRSCVIIGGEVCKAVSNFTISTNKLISKFPV